MPTYEYECKAGHRFEKFQSMLDKPLKKCPKCGKAATRLISAGAGVIFKGSGFYETDYKSKKPSKDPADSVPKKDGAPASPVPGDQARSPADRGEASAPKSEGKKKKKESS